ncbi:MAG: hypothetical protein ACO3TX_13535, partial [Pseudomonadales bacterium]
EPRTKNQKPRIKNQELNTKNHEPKTQESGIEKRHGCRSDLALRKQQVVGSNKKQVVRSK